ncbi:MULTISPECIES: hypothetical protein [Serratia]|uniref:hypothetical protein n=1 Tax=Serratia TaxID=613 RepID=UPI000F7F2474|nr:hypothetical protein [Serratia marcescens]RTF18680.1 hypothetical protein D9B84_14810 [Serratia marcescens]
MKKALLITALFISGCSSMSEMRNSPPAESFVSNKDAKSVSECILFGWQENSSRYGDVFIQPYRNGFTVYSPSNIELVDVFDFNGNTDIEYRHQSGIFSYRIDDRVSKIKNCI